MEITTFLKAFNPLLTTIADKEAFRLERAGVKVRSFMLNIDQNFDTLEVYFHGVIRLLENQVTIPVTLVIPNLQEKINDGTALALLMSMIGEEMFNLSSGLIAYYKGYH